MVARRHAIEYPGLIQARETVAVDIGNLPGWDKIIKLLEADDCASEKLPNTPDDWHKKKVKELRAQIEKLEADTTKLLRELRFLYDSKGPKSIYGELARRFDKINELEGELKVWRAHGDSHVVKANKQAARIEDMQARLDSYHELTSNAQDGWEKQLRIREQLQARITDLETAAKESEEKIVWQSELIKEHTKTIANQAAENQFLGAAIAEQLKTIETLRSSSDKLLEQYLSQAEESNDQGDV